MPPLRRALSAALLVLPMLLTSATAKDCGVRRPDGWIATDTGAFGSGDPRLTAFAVLPRNPDTMVVSNGAALKVSKDAGCTWAPVTLPQGGLLAGLGGGPRAIVDVTTSHPRTGVETVWVLANETGATTRPTAFRSTDGGATYAVADTGLPPVGDSSAIAAGIDDLTAYVVVDLPSPLGRRLYATTDGGGSWTATSPAGEFPYEHVVVDTVIQQQLYAWNSDTLAKSYDSGLSFEVLDLHADGLVRDVALGQAPRGSRLAVLLEGGRLLRSDDGGKSWTTRKVGVTAENVAAAPDLDAVVVSGAALVTLLPSVFREIDASPVGDPPLDLSLGLVSGSEVRMVGRIDTQVMTYVGNNPDGTDPLDLDLRSARLTVPVDPAVLPARAEVTLAPGETKVVDYELDVPTAPSPIEVFFLIDTTGSMSGVITGVRDGLVKMVNDLAAAGIASQFGVAEVKEYPFDPYSGPPDLPYKLFRKVGPVNDELADALAQLQASGGGDGPEAMPTGFYQLVTGEGQEVNGLEMVPRGADAGFSGRTMSIVLASTDTSYHREESYPGPAPEKAYAALRAKGIKVIGLAAAPGEAVRDLSETAEATGTFAPENGVDCDLDGKDELDEGDPLVCEITGGAAVNVEIGTGGGTPIVDTGGTAGIGGAIVSLLRQIHDPAVLTLRSSVPDVAKVLGNPSVPVDLKVPHALPYKVRLACPAARYGSTVDVRLTGARGPSELAAARVTVNCLAPERPPSEPVLDKVPRPLAAAAAVPPAPPVQPVNNLQPNMNPQPNPNAQMQAGVAQQEQQEFQVALALGDLPGFEEGEELAMVRHDQPPPALPAVAAMTAAAAAWGVAFRTGPMAAYVRRRRPY